MRLAIKDYNYTPQQLISYLDMCVENNGNDVGKVWDELKKPVNAGMYSLTRAQTGQYVLIGRTLVSEIVVLFVDNLGLVYIYSSEDGIIERASAADGFAIMTAFVLGVDKGARDGAYF